MKSLNSGPITFTHCRIYREALAAKKISAKLCVALQDAVKIIDYIKSRALNSRLFSSLCKEMDSEFSPLFSKQKLDGFQEAKL